MTKAAPAKVAHQARKMGAQLNKALARPNGHYHHSEGHWCYVAQIHPATTSNGTPTVDVYPDGAQNTNNPDYLIKAVKCLWPYVPTVGDAVYVLRGAGKMRTTRFVVGKLNGSASPYPLPLGGIDANGRYVAGPNAVWGGAGDPTAAHSPYASLGTTGDYFFRTDTPGTAGQRLYVRESTGWVATAL